MVLKSLCSLFLGSRTNTPNTSGKDRFTFREIDFDDSDSDLDEPELDNEDSDEEELPVITFRRRDRDTNVLSPIKSSSFSNSNNNSNNGIHINNITTINELSDKPSASVMVQNVKQEKEHVHNVTRTAGHGLPIDQTLKTKNNPQTAEFAQNTSPMKALNKLPAHHMSEKNSAVGQPIMTIKSTHRITYTTPVFEGATDQRNIPSSTLINVHPSNVTVNLTHPPDIPALGLDRGLSALSTPQKRYSLNITCDQYRNQAIQK